MSKLKHYLAISQTFYILFLSHTKKCLLISSILFPVSRFPCTSRQKKRSKVQRMQNEITSCQPTPPPPPSCIRFCLPFRPVRRSGTFPIRGIVISDCNRRLPFHSHVTALRSGCHSGSLRLQECCRMPSKHNSNKL